MNSGLDPLLLKKNQLSFATNLTTRRGFATDRPPFSNVLTITWPSEEVQEAFEQGLWQGCAYYQPDSGSQSLFASVSGRLFQFTIVGSAATVTERTIPGDPNPATATQAWMWQAENYLIVQDGISLPLFFDGTTTRRSNGPSILLAVATTSTSPAALAVPPIGSQVVLTLSGNWPDVYDTPVLFNGEYYQPIANSGGYVVNLTSLYSTGGAINVNDAVNIVPGYVGVVVATSAFTIGAAFTYPATVTVQMTAPYTGPFNPTFTGQAGKVLLFGKVWAATSAAGNNVTFTAGEPGVFSALPAGTVIQYVTAPSPNVLVGFNTILAADPGTGGTVQLTLSQAYTGSAGAVVYIGANQYTIAAVVPAAGVASVTMINLTDPTATYNFASPKDIISVPELPAGRMGCYGLGQNWMALIDGLSFICSDQSRGPSGTPANSYRDAVLKTTDLTFRGGNFAIPGAGNVITSMIFTANLDTALGQGSLEIGTAQFMGSVLAPFDFENPNNESPLLTYSLVDRGPLAQNSTVRVNSDIYFRSTAGIGSLVLARRDFNTPGNTPISEEVYDRLLELDNQALLTYGSAINFDNRFLMTLSPQASSQGVLHAGLVAQNLDPVSSVGNKQPPVYDGLWTGVNTLQLTGGLFDGQARAFAFTFNTSLSKLQLYEILRTGTQHFDNTNVPITWAFETAALFNSDVKPRETMVRLINGEFAVSDVIGTVRFEVFYKADQGCWVPWHAFSICASTAGVPQYFPRLGLGEPGNTDCDTILDSASRDGFTFQFKFIITGHCRFLRARFAAVTMPILKFPRPTCDVVEQVEITS